MVLYVLIALNVAVFALWQLLGSPSLMDGHFLVSSAHLADGRVWTLLSSAFSHISLNHLLFNLFALWVFGRHVEMVLGRLGMIQLYLVGGIVASLGHVGWNLLMGDAVPALGASGSVMAVSVAFAVLFPWQRLYLFFMIPLPAFVAVGLYVATDLFGLFDPTSTIGHAAHLGGAVYGLVIGFLWGRGRLDRLRRHAESDRLNRGLARYRRG